MTAEQGRKGSVRYEILASVTRRRALKLAATAAALPLVHIRSAGAAGKLNVGVWDHWVPGANDVMQKQINVWAEKNKVAVSVDFITSSGKKILITAAAESQAGNGHDFIQMYNWDVGNYAGKLEPVDDVVQALSGQYGTYGAIRANTWRNPRDIGGRCPVAPGH